MLQLRIFCLRPLHSEVRGPISFGVRLFIEKRNHLGYDGFIELCDVERKPVGQFGCARIQASCVDGDAGMGHARELHHLLGLVPDNIEIGNDRLHQMPGGPSPLSMLKCRKISR
jgi:hypothetical protein